MPLNESTWHACLPHKCVANIPKKNPSPAHHAVDDDDSHGCTIRWSMLTAFPNQLSRRMLLDSHGIKHIIIKISLPFFRINYSITKMDCIVGALWNFPENNYRMNTGGDAVDSTTISILKHVVNIRSIELNLLLWLVARLLRRLLKRVMFLNIFIIINVCTQISMLRSTFQFLANSRRKCYGNGNKRWTNNAGAFWVYLIASSKWR